MRVKSWQKTAFLVAFVLLLIGLFVFFELWGPAEKTPAPLKILPEKVDLQAKDVLYTEVGRGDIKYEIRSKTVTYQKKDNIADFDLVNVKLILPQGKTCTITADRGTYNTKAKNISMAGNVVVISDEGDRINTERLQYTDAERKIHTASPVTVVNKNIEVKGVGLILLLDKKQITLLSQVKATITSRPGSKKTEKKSSQKQSRGK